MTKKSNSELFASMLYVIIGVLLIVFRSQTLGWAMTIAGIVFMISGLLDLFKKNWAGGAVSLIIGLAIIILGWTATQIVLLVLGILIAIKGLVSLIDALRASNRTLLGILFPVLSIMVGLMLAFGNGLDVMIIIVGILLAIDGVVGLIGAMKKIE